jgi:hypothetical protein
MAACLVQIRTGFAAEWNQLGFSVESGAGEWTLRVEDTASHCILYAAQRAAASAARIAAAEYAIFRVLGPAGTVTPERLADTLPWRQYC